MGWFRRFWRTSSIGFCSPQNWAVHASTKSITKQLQTPNRSISYSQNVKTTLLIITPTVVKCKQYIKNALKCWIITDKQQNRLSTIGPSSRSSWKLGSKHRAPEPELGGCRMRLKHETIYVRVWYTHPKMEGKHVTNHQECLQNSITSYNQHIVWKKYKK